MLKQQIYLKNQEEMKNFASKLAKVAKSGDIITLSGDLGVGKTSFSQFFIRSLTDEDIEVTSPTFNLLHVYSLKILQIWHFDLYRLKNKQEIYELGIEDAFDNGVSLIEWPEIIKDSLPKNRLDLDLSFSKVDDARIINWKGSIKWAELLGSIK